MYIYIYIYILISDIKSLYIDKEKIEKIQFI